MIADWDAAISAALEKVSCFEEHAPTRATLAHLVETYFVYHFMAYDPEEVRRAAAQASETGVIELGEPRPESEPSAWAYSVVSDMIEDLQPADALELIMSLIEFAPDEDALGAVAAGPLEDFINDRGQEALDLIEWETIRSPKLREALAGVWLKEGPIADRVRRLADPPLE